MFLLPKTSHTPTGYPVKRIPLRRGWGYVLLLCDADVLRLGEEAQRFVAAKAFGADAALFHAAASIFLFKKPN